VCKQTKKTLKKNICFFLTTTNRVNNRGWGGAWKNTKPIAQKEKKNSTQVNQGSNRGQKHKGGEPWTRKNKKKQKRGPQKKKSHRGGKWAKKKQNLGGTKRKKNTCGEPKGVGKKGRRGLALPFSLVCFKPLTPLTTGPPHHKPPNPFPVWTLRSYPPPYKETWPPPFPTPKKRTNKGVERGGWWHTKKPPSGTNPKRGNKNQQKKNPPHTPRGTGWDATGSLLQDRKCCPPKHQTNKTVGGNKTSKNTEQRINKKCFKLFVFETKNLQNRETPPN